MYKDGANENSKLGWRLEKCCLKLLPARKWKPPSVFRLKLKTFLRGWNLKYTLLSLLHEERRTQHRAEAIFVLFVSDIKSDYQTINVNKIDVDLARRWNYLTPLSDFVFDHYLLHVKLVRNFATESRKPLPSGSFCIFELVFWHDNVILKTW